MTLIEFLHIVEGLFAVIGVLSTAAMIGAFVAFTLNRRVMRLRK